MSRGPNMFWATTIPLAVLYYPNISCMSRGPIYSLRQLGVGFTLEEFEKGVNDGTIAGHVGFHESIHMIADAIGWEIGDINKPDSFEDIQKGRHWPRSQARHVSWNIPNRTGLH
jgi:hypothetical protein